MQNEERTFRFLIVSDIHGNKEALQAAEKYLKAHPVNQIVCLGDVVGYGVDFEWCLNWLNNRKAIILKGNHESMIAGETSDENCSEIGQQTVRWTKKYMSEVSKKQTALWPMHYTYEKISFTHAGNKKDKEWPYIKDLSSAKKAFNDKHLINFFGHTHRACIISHTGEIIELYKNRQMILSLDKTYYINPGSIGQNRGKKTRACFMEVTIYKDKIIVRYLEKRYKAYRTYQKIQDSDMDNRIAEYLIREREKRNLYRIIYRSFSGLRRK